jgi:serine/threonine protein kinase
MQQSEILGVGLDPFPGYRLKRFLGRGGCGEVWEAETDSGALVALKFMPCESWASPREVKSIQNVRRLRHRHLIRIDQVWCFQQYLVVAMELAEGGLDDLYDAYQSQYGTVIGPKTLLLYMRQVATALDFLNARDHMIDGHRVGIQHGDVKPSNILLFGQTVKLSDFGLATPVTKEQIAHRKAGTLHYAAPELFQSRISMWTDQYALAVTYAQLRTGRLPFPDSPESFRSDYVRPAPDLELLPARERPVVSRALARRPEDRWQSCSTFMLELGRAMP